MVDINLKSELGRRLTWQEADANAVNLKAAIVALQNDRPEPNNIASVTVVGSAMTIHMDSGPPIGPLPLPVLTFKWRGAWTPFTLFDVLDTFVVEGVGIYSVLKAHTSGALFDPAIEAEGEPALQKIWGFEASDVGIIYDMEFRDPGVLADATRPPGDFFALRAFVLPGSADGEHLAYLEEPAASVRQVLPILHNATQIGTVTFEVGDNDGTVEIDAAEEFAFRDHLIVGLPAAADTTAAGLIIGLAARRIIR